MTILTLEDLQHAEQEGFIKGVVAATEVQVELYNRLVSLLKSGRAHNAHMVGYADITQEVLSVLESFQIDTRGLNLDQYLSE